jgi:hypothetical protein
LASIRARLDGGCRARDGARRVRVVAIINRNEGKDAVAAQPVE